MRYIFLLVGILLYLVFVTSCTPSSAPDSAPTQIPSSPTTSPPSLTEDWSADGIIKVREYHGSNNYGDYTIHWRSDEQYIHIGIIAKTNGWVAMALQPGSRMKDADMVLGFVKDGTVEVQDLYSTGDFGPHPLDSELGGTDDILEFGGREEGGFTTIEFKRSLTTMDKYDISIQKGVNRIIWAYGSSDSLTVKHSTRGYGEINL
jgi:hypothetical protein